MKKLRIAACVAGVALAFVPTTAFTSAPTLDARDHLAKLAWRPCPGLPRDMSLSCATLRVPLDYSRPSGPKIELDLNRLAAKDPSQRIGSLVLNPGGPGQSATQAIAAEASGQQYFTDQVRQRYDLIGLDERGVGRSTRIKCDPSIYNEKVSLFPRNSTEFNRLVEKNRKFGESCRKMTGPLIGHLDAVSQAKDLEMARRALGEGNLNFLGLSYGSLVGAQYAELFPGMIRIMALDGILDHSVDGITAMSDEATTYDKTLQRFFGWCDKSTECSLHRKNPRAMYQALVEKADRFPLRAAECARVGKCDGRVSGDDIRFNTQELLGIQRPLPRLFNLPGWNGLANAISMASKGDASAFASPLAATADDPKFPAVAVTCLEFAGNTRTYADMQYKELLGRDLSPTLKGASQTWSVQAQCMGWPVPQTNRPRPLKASPTSHVLLVNSTHDPSDSYVWAVSVQRQIKGSVLLTRSGNGHTSYFLHGGETQAAITRYLLDGSLPPTATVLPS
ncbi:alpha/beta hydrolase [Streptomyces roseus]|uniref:alpha/beta hydrolase n=1 Tax=Streptomyces roseus TaxID=66430 RepID=UPI0036A8B4C4